MATPDPATTEWVPIWTPKGVIAGGGGGAGGPHHLTHEPGGSDAIVNLNGAVITTGTVADARLSANVALKNVANVFTADQTVNGVVVATGGLGSTPLNASQLTSGLVPLARLPANLVYTDTVQTISGNKSFTGLVHMVGPATSPTIQGFTPSVNFYENSGGVNQHYTRWSMANGVMQLQTLDDAYANVLSTLLQVDRAGVMYGNGAQMINLNADYIATGRVNQARLGSGSFNSGTFLRGDGVWAATAGVPAGLIAIFSASCPVGWSRVAGLDGRFPRGATSWGATGGNSSHSHGVGGAVGSAGGHAHSATLLGSGSGGGKTGFLTTNNIGGQFASNTSFANSVHDHDFNVTINVTVAGNTDAVGDHSHSFSGSSDTANHVPPYVDVVFCIKD